MNAIIVTLFVLLSDGSKIGVDYSVKTNSYLHHSRMAMGLGRECDELVADTYGLVKSRIQLAGQPVQGDVVNIYYRCAEGT